MTVIGDARDRLQAAVARLEAALDRPDGSPPQNGELADALEAARSDYHALKSSADSVAGRLDSMIARLRGLLGEQAERTGKGQG